MEKYWWGHVWKAIRSKVQTRKRFFEVNKQAKTLARKKTHSRSRQIKSHSNFILISCISLINLQLIRVLWNCTTAQTSNDEIMITQLWPSKIRLHFLLISSDRCKILNLSCLVIAISRAPRCQLWTDAPIDIISARRQGTFSLTREKKNYGPIRQAMSLIRISANNSVDATQKKAGEIFKGFKYREPTRSIKENDVAVWRSGDNESRAWKSVGQDASRQFHVTLLHKENRLCDREGREKCVYTKKKLRWRRSAQS